MTKHTIQLKTNDQTRTISVDARKTLLDTLREDCNLTGAHAGCEHGVCGACTVILDGEPIRSCLMFAVQAEGKMIRTVEGLAQGDALHPMQKAFIEQHAVQCGFCTPGFLMLTVAALEKTPDMDDEALREVVASNLCRCTGYENVLVAVRIAADHMRHRT
jgi:carbon-monoxide dehydrogenase small subunit